MSNLQIPIILDELVNIWQNIKQNHHMNQFLFIYLSRQRLPQHYMNNVLWRGHVSMSCQGCPMMPFFFPSHQGKSPCLCSRATSLSCCYTLRLSPTISYKIVAPGGQNTTRTFISSWSLIIPIKFHSDQFATICEFCLLW